MSSKWKRKQREEKGFNLMIQGGNPNKILEVEEHGAI
jgi:hypothetical protein